MVATARKTVLDFKTALCAVAVVVATCMACGSPRAAAPDVDAAVALDVSAKPDPTQIIPCQTDSDCTNGQCIFGRDGGLCARSCGLCGDGEVCRKRKNGSLCLPRWVSLCAPCAVGDDSTCQAANAADTAACRDLPGLGAICTAPCTGDCPSGFMCTSGWCVPASGSCDCSEWAVRSSASGICKNTNGFGSCPGTLSCSSVGPWPSCAGASPGPELCNNVDDNCNGVTDEWLPCDDGNPCTVNDKCVKGICTPQFDKCDDNNVCTNDTCSPTGACSLLAVANGTPCGPGKACQYGVCAKTLPAVAISVASGGACAIDSLGDVHCWGWNGLLSSFTGSAIAAVPGPPVYLPAPAQDVVAGGSHNCARLKDGAVWCWGLSYGNGPPLGMTPVAIAGWGAGTHALAAGDLHTCAVLSGGVVQCMGGNYSGQLGNGGKVSPPTPVAVVGLGNDVTAVAAGAEHSCALMASGSVWCWGAGKFGQLGNGYGLDSSTPVQVYGMNANVVAIAAGGDRTCAMKADGSVWCWGAKFGPVPPSGVPGVAPTPVYVPGLGAGGVALAVGGTFACRLNADGSVWCWGDNAKGALGNGTLVDSATPLAVTGLAGKAVAIGAGGDHACALVNGGPGSDGIVQCWGEKANGVLGNGDPAASPIPVDVVGLPGPATSVTAGAKHACALLVDGTASCWGDNSVQELGDGTFRPSDTPVPAAMVGSGLQAAYAGDFATVGWGSSGAVQTTNQMGFSAAAWVAGLAVGGSNVCAWFNAGGLGCWGDNKTGAFGDGTTANSSFTPSPSLLTGTITCAATSGRHTCAAKNDGSVWCWGLNQSGEVGTGAASMTPVLSPQVVVGAPVGVTALATNVGTTCVIDAVGGLSCWGLMPVGLSGAPTTKLLKPTGIVGYSSGVAAVTLGGFSMCILTTAGAVLCAGQNDFGQLGVGTWDSKTTLTPVSGLSSGVAAIAAAQSNTCAVLTTGGVRCWGDNSFGQLGNGAAWSPVPVTVLGFGN